MTNDGTVMTMPVQPANTAGNGGFGWGGEGSWFIIILFLFAFLGGGRLHFDQRLCEHRAEDRQRE